MDWKSAALLAGPIRAPQTAEAVDITPAYDGKVSGNRYAMYWDDFQGKAPGDWYQLASFSLGQAVTNTIINGITGADSWRGICQLSFAATSGLSCTLSIGHFTEAVAGAAGSNIWRTGDRMQFVWCGATVFDPGATNDYGLSVGFTNRGAFDPWSIATTAGYSYAVIYKTQASPYWICYSRSGTNQTDETTTTTVAHASNVSTTLRVLIETTGNVLFYIDGTLVATHSGNGKIADGDFVSPVLTWKNNALLAAGSSSRYLYFDAVGALFTYPDGSRTTLEWQ